MRCAGRRSATGAVSGVKAVASSLALVEVGEGRTGNRPRARSAIASQSPVVVRAAADVEAPPTSDMPEAGPRRGFKVYETMIIYNPDAQDGGMTFGTSRTADQAGRPGRCRVVRERAAKDGVSYRGLQRGDLRAVHVYGQRRRDVKGSSLRRP